MRAPSSSAQRLERLVTAAGAAPPPPAPPTPPRPGLRSAASRADKVPTERQGARSRPARPPRPQPKAPGARARAAGEPRAPPGRRRPRGGARGSEAGGCGGGQGCLRARCGGDGSAALRGLELPRKPAPLGTRPAPGRRGAPAAGARVTGGRGPPPAARVLGACAAGKGGRERGGSRVRDAGVRVGVPAPGSAAGAEGQSEHPEARSGQVCAGLGRAGAMETCGLDPAAPPNAQSSQGGQPGRSVTRRTSPSRPRPECPGKMRC